MKIEKATIRNVDINLIVDCVKTLPELESKILNSYKNREYVASLQLGKTITMYTSDLMKAATDNIPVYRINDTKHTGTTVKVMQIFQDIGDIGIKAYVRTTSNNSIITFLVSDFELLLGL